MNNANDPTYIYHITHIDNLASIINAGGLWSDAERIKQGFGTHEIGYANIKQRRLSRPVPIAAKGFVGDYVPFYFGPRSPMLFTINCRNTTYQGGQQPIVHLLTTTSQAQGTGSPFCFTDGHAEMGMACFSDNLDEIENHVDLPVMKQTYWNDTANDPTKKFRRQAEFLVHRSFPWDRIMEIGVIDDGMVQAVSNTIGNASHIPNIAVKRGWYY